MKRGRLGGTNGRDEGRIRMLERKRKGGEEVEECKRMGTVRKE